MKPHTNTKQKTGTWHGAFETSFSVSGHVYVVTLLIYSTLLHSTLEHEHQPTHNRYAFKEHPRYTSSVFKFNAS